MGRRQPPWWPGVQGPSGMRECPSRAKGEPWGCVEGWGVQTRGAGGTGGQPGRHVGRGVREGTHVGVREGRKGGRGSTC